MQRVTRYILAYLLWAVSVALAIFALFTWRSSAMVGLGITQWDRYIEHALNQFGFLFFAIIGLCAIVFAEHFYRTGVEKERLFARFFLVTFIQLVIITLAHTLQLVGAVVLDFFSWGMVLVFLGDLVVGGIVFLLYRYIQNQSEIKPSRV